MKLIKLSLIAIIVLLIGSPIVMASEEVAEEVIVPTIESGPSLELTTDTITVEYGEEVNPTDFLSAGYWDQLELPSIDTNQLGTQTLFFIAKKGLNEAITSMELVVADTTPPVFDKKISELVIDYNEEVDLLDWFEASDETEAEVQLTLSQELDNTKEGKQEIIVTATDPSGNATKQQVTVTVKEKPKPKPKPVLVQAPSQPAQQATAQTTTSSEMVNNTFSARVTYYGIDCYGCRIDSSGRGYLASGVPVSTTAVFQNGSWVPGITYKGYYILAAGSQYAFCTVIDIYNHTLSGGGISPSQPIRGIVLDRGGGVSGNHFDVFVGSERNPAAVHVGGSPRAQVVGYNPGCY